MSKPKGQQKYLRIKATGIVVREETAERWERERQQRAIAAVHDPLPQIRDRARPKSSSVRTRISKKRRAREKKNRQARFEAVALEQRTQANARTKNWFTHGRK